MKTIAQIMDESADTPVDPESGETNLWHLIKNQKQNETHGN